MLWMLFIETLNTKDRLQRFGIQTDGVCCFCGDPESADHLFFQCSFSRQIWLRVLGWMGYTHQPTNWLTEKAWIMQVRKNKGWRREVTKVTIAETVYGLWFARNNCIFSHQVPNLHISEEILHNVVTRCQMSPKLALRLLYSFWWWCV